MAITPLPTPPSTSDPSTFATKADALLSALPTFVTEANALQVDVNASEALASASAIDAVSAKNAAESFVNATKWISGTTYGEGDVVWSPSNFKSYRRKTTGAGTTDPSLDTTNWASVSYFDNAATDIASASTVDLTSATGNTARITGTNTVTAFTMNAGQQMELIAVGALPLTYNATTMNINGGASYTCAAGDRLRVFKDGSGVVRVNVTKQDGTHVVGSQSISQGNSSVTVTDSGTGKIEKTVDGVIISEETATSRKSTIDGGSTLYPEFKCRAWAKVTGTGTASLDGSGNIATFTDGGTGIYVYTFVTAMPDTNYAIVCSSTLTIGTRQGGVTCSIGAKSTTGFTLYTSSSAAAPQDHVEIDVSVYR